MRIYISADMRGVKGDDLACAGAESLYAGVQTARDYETAFQMFIGVMRPSRSDPDYG